MRESSMGTRRLQIIVLPCLVPHTCLRKNSKQEHAWLKSRFRGPPMYCRGLNRLDSYALLEEWAPTLVLERLVQLSSMQAQTFMPGNSRVLHCKGGVVDVCHFIVCLRCVAPFCESACKASEAGCQQRRTLEKDYAAGVSEWLGLLRDRVVRASVQA